MMNDPSPLSPGEAPRVQSTGAQHGVGQDQTYTVQPGDTLAGIADRFYGRPDWKRLFDANREKLATPGHVAPGQVLRIPGRED